MTTGGLAKRDVPMALAEDINSPVLRPFMAVRIDTPDPVRGFTGKGTIIVDGEEYTGFEGIGSLDPVRESLDGSAVGMKARLDRIPAELAPDVSAQAVRGSTFEVFFGTLNAAFTELRAFKRIWRGTLQGFDVIDEGETLSVVVSGENRQIDQRRPAIKRFTDEWQQRKHPGDRVFEYVPRMAEINIMWAKAKDTST